MKFNQPFADTLAERLTNVPGIGSVETGTVTASTVLYYDPKELGQPAALLEWREAWMNLFPGMQMEKLPTAVTGLMGA